MKLMRLTRSAIFSSFAATFLVAGLSANALADQLSVAFSFAKPPYVFAQKLEDTFDTRGIELELMTQALAFKGHSFTPVYSTYDRLNGLVEAGKADAAATVRPEVEGLFYSQEFVYFHNFAITRKDAPPLKTMGDLVGRSVVAWQGATKDLGPAFDAVDKQAGVYKEIPDQQRQVKLFLKGRANTIIIDGAIFKYWAKELGENPSEFNYSPLFGGKTSFVVGFKSEQFRDDFVAGMKKLRDSGEYKKIYRRFIGD